MNSIICHCIKLRRVANMVTSYYDNAMQHSGLSVNQYSLLRNIQKQGTCSVSALAAHVRLERTTLVRNLKPLLAKGYIEDLSLSGQRNRRLRLTKAGLAVLDIAVPLWERTQHEIEDLIGIPQLAVLEQTFAKLEKI